MCSNNHDGRGHMFMTVVVSFCLCALMFEFAGSGELKTSDGALDRALAYAGFEKMRGFSRPNAATSTITMSIVDTTTPLLSERISGEDRWVVTFKNVYLEMDSIWSEYNHSIQLRKTFKFYLDSQNGQLLKVVGRTDLDTCQLPPLPHVSKIERFFQATQQSYAGLVDDPPPVSFYNALEKARFAQPLRAKEIYAWLVVMAPLKDAEPQSRWVIVGRGVPAVPAFGVDAPTVDAQHSWTCFECHVDANTGKILGCASLAPWEPDPSEQGN